MTLGTLMLLVLIVYLALIAYGVVGSQRKLTGAALRITRALLVLLVPVMLAGALVASGEGDLVRQWWRFFALMPVLGVLVALLASRIGRHIEP
jgi:heme A synthase